MYKELLTIILILLAGFALSVVGYYLLKPKPSRSSVETTSFPALSLPLKYFSQSDFVWGDAASQNGGFPVGYTPVNPAWSGGQKDAGLSLASFDNGDGYQTYPTTTITFTDYSNTPKPLSSEDMSATSIGEKKTFAVEGDGSKETIEVLCATDSADGWCGEARIIKGNEIIFEAYSDYVDILPSDTGNGFYVESENNVLEPSRCCALGYVKTRFVYAGGTFKPIYEQEVYYLNVKNSSDGTQ